MNTHIKLALTFFVMVSISPFTKQSFAIEDISEICLSKEEKALYDEINQYRKRRGLNTIKLSRSLSFVAKQHAFDLANNNVTSKKCNMHSWSDNERWTGCCYTNDHKEARCMWNKPKELTDYPGDGYEIVFYSTYEYNFGRTYSKDALDSWSKSKGHNSVILNLGVWKNINWSSIGIGIFEGYACVWFGKEEDLKGTVLLCE